MSGSTAVLREICEQQLTVFLYDSALFLAERLYYQEPCEAHLNLVAQCMLRMGQHKQVRMLLEGAKEPANRYLFALACIELGKYAEAEAALFPVKLKPGKAASLSDEDVAKVPFGAAGLFLLGKVCRAENRREMAVACFRRSLEMDPTMWGSLAALSEMGEYVDVDGMFGVENKVKTKPVVNIRRNVRFLDEQTTPAAPAAATAAEVAQHEERHNHGLEITSVRSSARRASFLGVSSFSLPMPAISPAPPLTSPMRPMPNLSASFNQSTRSIPPKTLFSTPDLTPIASSHDDGSHVKTVRHLETPRSDMLDSDVKSSFAYSGRTPGEARGKDYRSLMGRGGRLSFSTALEEDEKPSKMRKNAPPPPQYTPVHSSTANVNNSHTNVTNPSIDAGSESVRHRQSTGARVTSNGIPSAAADRSRGVTPTSRVTRSAVRAERKSLPPERTKTAPRRARASTGAAGVASTPSAAATPAGAATPAPPSAAAAAATPAPVTTKAAVQQQQQQQQEQQQLQQQQQQQQQAEGERLAAELLSHFGKAYRALCLYDCDNCLQLLHSTVLPTRHFHSGWVQQIIGRAYFEMGEYASALHAFHEMRRAEPYRLQGIEYMSTTLWHLKRDKELSALAQQVTDIDRCAPQTWCVVGNCFSLQREHDTAIKFFGRAMQLDKTFTYAYTLSGHEFVANEDLDKAIVAFRHAIRYDDRHYNAWYGLGAIYYRQEKLALAEYHFRKALSINRSSPVLQCCVGMVLHALGKSEEALQLLDESCLRNPENAQLRFQRATVLAAVEDYEAAFEELQRVQQLVPREPPVYALLGEVCQQLGRTQDAVRYFNIALDLEPKDNSGVKANLEQLDEPEMPQAEVDVL